jgi:hypothetical protein
MKHRPLVLLPLLLALLACAPVEPEPEAPAATEAPAAAEAPAPAEDLRSAARSVAEALRDRDFEALAGRAHPDGVRFSPYSYVDPEAHLTLSPAELRAAGEGSPRTWGHHDGSGEPIETTVDEYFDRFVWDAPYLEEGSVAVDRRQAKGNSVDNAAQVYPDARIVEYHVPGRNPDFGGMDWRSLRLVFEEGEGSRWLLVAVIHDEWTI